MVSIPEATSPIRLSSNRSRAACRLGSLIAATLLVACAGQAQQPASTQSSDRAPGVEPRYDPAAENAEEIRETLSPCWAVDPDVPLTRVAVVATLDIDGAVLEADASEPDRYRTDDAYRYSADRAIRAVRNPACQPLPFSAEDWPSWQTVTLVFDPNPRPGGN